MNLQLVGFTKQQIEEIKEKNLIQINYDKYMSGEMARDEYSLFMLKLLCNFSKDLIAQHHRTVSSKADYEDFVSAGNEAVIAHLDEFNPSMGAPTTFFKNHINDAMKRVAYTGDDSKHYITVINKLNKVAQFYGFEDALDEQLTPHMLYNLSGKAYELKTIQNAIKYKQESTTCSWEALSENQDVESPYATPEKAFIDKEFRNDIAVALAACTSFERYLLENCIMATEGARLNQETIVGYCKEASFRAQFEDDDIINKNKVNKEYIKFRINNVLIRFRENSTIRTYGQMKEAMQVVADEQCCVEDIANAIMIGDLM